MGTEANPERFKDYNSGKGSEAHLASVKHKIKEVLSESELKTEIAERLSKMNFDELENRGDILCDGTKTKEVRWELEMIRDIMVALIESKKKEAK